ncbi:MAG: isoleucine--tRNA ligase [Spirochaetaceae bacterium]|nr:isoleucine--tRNA ligase [Spirochaetaceae bacterium]
MYKQVDPRISFPEMEEAILKFWNDKGIFQRSIDQRDGSPEYVFYDGPPFATGLPHFGHFVPGTLKDIIPRYQTMRGKKVERRFGWDCHGLPVEYEMEKELGISGKTEIEKFGVSEFNEQCRSIVLRYTSEWQTVINRLGRWVDFDNDYKTMDPDYMESIWWVFKQLWDKGLVYEGHKILPYCPRCSTVLSNHELNLGGYQDVHDPAITVRFAVKGEENTYLLAWTTTPWTLPSNLALAAGPNIEYVKVKDGDEFFILGEERLSAYYKSEEDYEIVARYKGTELEGLSYEPLFDYFAEEAENDAFKVYLADYVTTEDGSGLVHTAPGFGEDDYNTLKKTNITVKCPIDDECRFTDEVPEYTGRFVKDCDKDIITKLREEGKLVKRDQYLHSYPHCWRCKSPLIYRAVSSWFVDVPKIKQKMVNANNQINWVPSHLQQGRFGKWLADAREWAISRNRYWGNPIPVWKCPDCGDTLCIGSRAELKERSGKDVNDLHKHFVDDILIKCKCGSHMKRIPEVLDCWFESGAMPYAQNHYPFENKEKFEANFPAEFISEGLDQTRGWFYTLTILAAALFDKPAFKNVIVNGLVLAEDGKKMSKSERNYADPMLVIGEYGADALRLFLMNSACVRGEGLKFSNDGVKEVLKSIIIPFWNAYSFFITYANIDKVRPSSKPVNPENPLDKWILSETEKMVEDVIEQLEGYEIQKAIGPIVSFIDLLNNWYIRRSRRRFWKSENDGDKLQAYSTLYHALMTVIKVAAPIIPFVTEEIYQNLKTADMPDSIHLCDYPIADIAARDRELELKMSLTQQAVSMGRALRSMHNLKTRQPLKALHIVTRNLDEKKVLIEMVDIIREELNIKEVIFRDNEEDLVEYSAKANFRILGKILGKDMKAAASRIETLSMDEIQTMLEGSTLNIEFDGVEHKVLDITEEHLMIQRQEKENLKVLNEGSLTIALDPEITEELRNEGIVRDIVRSVQNLRKDSNLDVTDRINLFIDGSDEVKVAVEAFEDHLMQETLTSEWTWEKKDNAIEAACGDERCLIALTKKD